MSLAHGKSKQVQPKVWPMLSCFLADTITAYDRRSLNPEQAEAALLW
jgi:hypothetical protein